MARKRRPNRDTQESNSQPGNRALGSGNSNNLTPSLSALSVTRSAPAFEGMYASTWIGEGPAGDEDAFYHLVFNFFDPREQSRGTTYSINGNFGIEDILKQILERRFSRAISSFPVPDIDVIDSMMDSILDISRMLGIYLTYQQCEASLDRQLIQRNRDFALNRNSRSMRNILSRLPIPSNLRTLVTFYNRLVNISSGSPTYTGFLTAGDYDTFLALYDNVRSGTTSRRRAFTELLRIYPEIGEINNASIAQGMEIPTIIEAFINANYKLVTSATDRTARYTAVSGAHPNQQAMWASGWLSTVVIEDGDTNELYTMSRFAAPGSGSGSDSTQTNQFPAICRYNSTREKDAMLAIADTDYAVAGGEITFEQVGDQSILEMFAIQHNIQRDADNGYVTVRGITPATGEGVNPFARPQSGDPWPSNSGKVALGHAIGTNHFKEDANSIHMLRILLDEVPLRF